MKLRFLKQTRICNFSMKSIEQTTGFTFDSMDFSMSRSSSALIHARPNNLAMEDWEEGESNQGEDGANDSEKIEPYEDLGDELDDDDGD